MERLPSLRKISCLFSHLNVCLLSIGPSSHQCFVTQPGVWLSRPLKPWLPDAAGAELSRSKAAALAPDQAWLSVSHTGWSILKSRLKCEDSLQAEQNSSCAIFLLGFLGDSFTTLSLSKHLYPYVVDVAPVNSYNWVLSNSELFFFKLGHLVHL